MRNILLLIFIGFFTAACIANDTQIDSLQKIILTLPDDSAKVDVLLALSASYYDKSLEEALAHAVHAKKLAEQIKYKNGEAYALKNIGIVHYRKGEYVAALNNWEESLRLFEKTGNKKGQSNLLTNIGSVYYTEGDEAKSLELDLKSLNLAEEIGDTLRMLTSLSNIGVVYSTKKNTYDKALEYYQRALPLCVAINETYMMGKCLSGIGEIYFLKGSTFDSIALHYFQESATAHEGADKAYPLNFIGKIYTRKKDYVSALKYHREALADAEKLNSRQDMVQSLIGLGDVYAQMKDTKEAIGAYRKAEDIAGEICKSSAQVGQNIV